MDLLSLERDFVETEFAPWFKESFPFTLKCSCVYLAIVFTLKQYMKNRAPFDLRLPLAIWSGSLAIFSIIGAAKTIPERISVVQNHGWAHSVCNAEFNTGPVGFWSFLFMLSKVYEFGDTIFIVLRKQNLIFLHWYHHVTVVIFTWYLRETNGYAYVGRWFVVTNYTVHAFMYSYYTLKALKIRVPKPVAMSITVMQILQMLWGLTANGYALILYTGGRHCDTTYFCLSLPFFLYGTYFILFASFFHTNYLKAGHVKQVMNGKKSK